MLLSRCAIVMAFMLVSWTAVDGHYYMMKALLHGAGMGMMLQTMRPRLLPIPIPFPTGMFSGFLRQYEQPKQPEKNPVLLLQDQNPQPQIFIIQGHQNEPQWF